MIVGFLFMIIIIPFSSNPSSTLPRRPKCFHLLSRRQQWCCFCELLSKPHRCLIVVSRPQISQNISSSTSYEDFSNYTLFFIFATHRFLVDLGLGSRFVMCSIDKILWVCVVLQIFFMIIFYDILNMIQDGIVKIQRRR